MFVMCLNTENGLTCAFHIPCIPDLFMHYFAIVSRVHMHWREAALTGTPWFVSVANSKPFGSWLGRKLSKINHSPEVLRVWVEDKGIHHIFV